MNNNIVANEFKATMFRSLYNVPTVLIDLITTYDSRSYTPEQLFSFTIDYQSEDVIVKRKGNLAYQKPENSPNSSYNDENQRTYRIYKLLDLSGAIAIHCGLQSWSLEPLVESTNWTKMIMDNLAIYFSKDQAIEVQILCGGSEPLYFLWLIHFNLDKVINMQIGLKREQFDAMHAEYATLQAQL